MSLLTIYIILAVIGGLILLVSILGGDADDAMDIIGDIDSPDLDMDGTGVSVFSLKTIAVFMLGYSIAGIIAINLGATLFYQTLFGFIAGIGESILYLLIMKFMYSMQGSSMTSNIDLTGKIGVVIIPTTKSGIASFNIGPREYTCREVNNDKLERNDRVKIVDSTTSDRLILVEKVK